MVVSMIDHLVIVAGGKGTRLAARFGDLPKILVPVGGKPVLAHQLTLAAKAGIRYATIFAGHLAEKVQEYVGDGSRFGLHVQVLIEKEPLGNAGAILESLDLLPEHFFVAYGDVMLAVDLGKMAERHLRCAADFTTFAHPNDHPQDLDLLEADADGWVSAIHTYPHPEGRYFANLVNAALYVVHRDALRSCETLGGSRSFTKDVVPALLANGARVLAYRSSEYIKDMGTPARLERVQADLQAGRLDVAQTGKAAPAIFFDRDGTLNVEKGFLRHASDLELVPGASAALRSLRQAGYRLALLTNQPVIARGEATEADIAEVHRRLEWELGLTGAFLDGVYVCPHHPDRGFPGERTELKIVCDCRKPDIGLFRRACDDMKVDVAKSWMIGDQTRDIEMARRAGLRSILVRTGLGGRDGRFHAEPDHVAEDITAAAEFILKQQEALS